MRYVPKHLRQVVALLLLACFVAPAWSQQLTGGDGIKIGIIDVTRLVTDSAAGKEVLGMLQQLSESKGADLQVLANELESLQAQINEGRLSLSEARISELERQIEDKTIAFRRARDDADRQLQEMQAERFGEIERQVMPIINEVGAASGYTLIFNKFESGLVYAQGTADITDEILQRFDAGPSGQAAEPAPPEDPAEDPAGDPAEGDGR